MANRLILASRSPRRYELLKQMGIDFEVIPSRVEEENLVQNESPRDHVLRLSDAKALDVGRQYPNDWVIGADTIVTINGVILGKPKTPEEALVMLGRLSGQEHQVLSGIAVRHLSKEKAHREAIQTAVKMKTLNQDEMKWYIGTGEPFDKAGSYAIQGIGSFMIEAIQGSYTNVVGLPLCELIQMLERLGTVTISERGIRIVE
jgi:septum formation protein